MGVGEKFRRARIEHMRLSILQLLEKVGGDVQESLMRAAIHELGHRPVSLRHELDWLAEHGLIRIAEGGGPAVMRLTEHGATP